MKLLLVSQRNKLLSNYSILGRRYFIGRADEL